MFITFSRNEGFNGDNVDDISISLSGHNLERKSKETQKDIDNFL